MPSHFFGLRVGYKQTKKSGRRSISPGEAGKKFANEESKMKKEEGENAWEGDEGGPPLCVLCFF